jgi:antirestriction protein ArdC
MSGRPEQHGRHRRQSQPEKLATAAERDARLQALHDSLVDGVRALVESDEWCAMLAMAARLHNYSWRNCLLILQQKPDATRVAGYRTWQSLGRQVRRGEPGIAVLAPVTYPRDEPDGDQTEERAAVDDQARGRQLRGWKVEHVFDVSQTDGDRLPEVRPQLVEGEAPDGAWAAVAAQVLEEGFQLLRECDPQLPEAMGTTDFVKRIVRVRADVSDAQALKTGLHELAHIRLDHGPGECRDPRSRREVEAESVAYIVCQALGVDTASYSFTYIGSWAGSGREEEEVAACAERVIAGARQILEGTPEG